MKNIFTKTEKPFIIENINGESKDLVTIKSLFFYSDDTTTKNHKINLKKVIGFKLHWRSSGWHVKVIENSIGGEDNHTYELSHELYSVWVMEMIADDRIKILSIHNDHNSDNFLESLKNVMGGAELRRNGIMK